MAKHFMLYYAKGTGSYVVTEPRPWARENRHYFPQFDFINSHPTTNDVETFLIQHHGFHIGHTNNPDISLIQNLDTTIKI
jgi:hypothetical protein